MRSTVLLKQDIMHIANIIDVVWSENILNPPYYNLHRITEQICNTRKSVDVHPINMNKSSSCNTHLHQCQNGNSYGDYKP